MTRKQINKLANELAKLELIHQNIYSSEEEKRKAEDRIMQISNQIMSAKNGLETMMEIDEIVQSKLENNI